jgi:hypothetical protein
MRWGIHLLVISREASIFSNPSIVVTVLGSAKDFQLCYLKVSDTTASRVELEAASQGSEDAQQLALSSVANGSPDSPRERLCQSTIGDWVCRGRENPLVPAPLWLHLPATAGSNVLPGYTFRQENQLTSPDSISSTEQNLLTAPAFISRRLPRAPIGLLKRA